jgi:hypothetical protein
MMAQGTARTEEEALNYIRPIIPLLQRGMSEVQACDYAKISIDTLNHYKRKWESVYIEIRTAKMHLIATASDTIAKNIDDPKIALEVLKRRSKATWGDNIDLTTQNEKLSISLVEFIGNDDEQTKD